MKIVFFHLLLFLLCEPCLSQNESKIEYLKKILPQLHDSARVDCLNQLSELYKGLPAWFEAVVAPKNQTDSAEALILSTLEEAKKLQYNNGIAKALSLKAEIAFDKYNDYTETENLCRQAIYQYKRSGNKTELYKVYWRLGTALYVLSRFDDATNSFDTSYYLSKAAGDSLYMLYSVVQACNVNLDKGDYAKAFDKVLQFHQLIKDNNDPKWKRVEFGMLGDLSMQLEDYNSAINYFRQTVWDNRAFATAFYLNNQMDSAKKYFNLYTPDTTDQRQLESYLNFSGDYYSLVGNYQTALPYLLRALNYSKQSKDANSIRRRLIDISQAHLALHNFDSAFHYAQEGLAIARQTDAKRDIRNACKIISVVYDHSHRVDSAYFYYKQYVAINDFYVNNKVNGRLAAYEFEQKIGTLNNEKKNQQVQLEKQALEKYVLIAAIAIFFFIAFLLWRNNRHKQKANVLLQEQKEKVETTLTELKSTQAQLIQSEKMASLGELTAGIAHEIQNPLNFVNNFSEINAELIDELNDEAKKGNFSEVQAIAKDIKENEQKINHHGKRADAIVKGMLQHSRKNTGIIEPTNINKLADEYLRLSYQGLRARDKNFNAEIKTDFDDSIGKINLVPQDIGRVLLNIINNAFYAVNEKKKTADENYQPAVSIQTKKINDKIEIKVSDNGNGIPQNIIDKIFQPFFTTKPTGQGTGLGLSLSYDIIKGHGGEIKVETKEGEGTTFNIELKG